MTLIEIKELATFCDTANIAEIDVSRGETRVSIKRAAFVPSGNGARNTSTALTDRSPSHTAVAPVPPAKNPENGVPLIEIKSPTIGTYYDTSRHESTPFVKVGDKVKSGQVLCIIESLRVATEIKSETAGTVAAAHIQNGRPVEYGQLLFTLQAAMQPAKSAARAA